jgi:hypothetical protein
MPTLTEEISAALRLAGDAPERIAVIAPLMAKAIQSLPIKNFHIVPVRVAGLVSPEYTFGPTRHSVHNATSSKITANCIDGSFLHRGKLLRFAQATWFGEFEIPHIWNSPAFREKLALSTSHLDTVEEMIWLGGFWYSRIDYSTVVAEYKMVGKCKDIDWRFRCVVPNLQRWLNMEVKRRNTDLEQLCPGGEELARPFADIPQKFSTSADDEINVAAITLYGSEPEQIAARATNWLRQNTMVDCILLWNEITAKFASTSLESKKQKLDWVRLFLDPPVPQGLVPVAIRHGIEVPGVPRIQ